MSINKYNPTTGELELLAGGGNDVLYADAPIGAIIPYGGSTAPDGFLLCQGQAVSRTTYAELFAVIGTSFGSGDGSTTFNVPDLREATTKGVGLSGKSNNHFDSDGVALGEFVEDRLQAHTHSHKIGSSTAGSEEWVMFATNQVLSGMNQTDYGVIGRFGNTTEVKAVGVNYIIKAIQVAVPVDLAPVDVVENGNMKAVTSNAVYDALSDGKKIKIATPTFATGVTGTAQYHWQRNECTVLMQGVDVPANFIFNSNFITNLPQAASDAIVQYGTLYVLEWDGSAWQGQRVALTNIPAGDTALKADGNIGGAANTVRVYGSFTYRTKDWYEGE